MELSDFHPDDRVQLAPHTDLWIRGARYGTVVKIAGGGVHVKLDSYPRIRKFSVDDIAEHIPARPFEGT